MALPFVSLPNRSYYFLSRGGGIGQRNQELEDNDKLKGDNGNEKNDWSGIGKYSALDIDDWVF
jgi:hypothetical protein